MQKRTKWSVIDTRDRDAIAIVSEHETREEALAACPRLCRMVASRTVAGSGCFIRPWLRSR